MYIYVWLDHFATQQKLTQHCKSTKNLKSAGIIGDFASFLKVFFIQTMWTHSAKQFHPCPQRARNQVGEMGTDWGDHNRTWIVARPVEVQRRGYQGRLSGEGDILTLVFRDLKEWGNWRSGVEFLWWKERQSERRHEVWEVAVKPRSWHITCLLEVAGAWRIYQGRDRFVFREYPLARSFLGWG